MIPPPCSPLSTRSCSSNHLPYTCTRAKQNERECPNQRPEIFFWEERTSKTRRVDLSGLPELKIVTSVIFWGRARLLLQNCGFWWRITTSSLQKERSSIFCGDSPLFKAYPRQATVCSTVGGSTGAIDPTTLRKYMWPFIRAIADLEPALVSINMFSFLHLSNVTHIVSSRLISKAGKIVAVWMTASSV